jgi:hypothetical protein
MPKKRDSSGTAAFYHFPSLGTQRKKAKAVADKLSLDSQRPFWLNARNSPTILIGCSNSEACFAAL